MEGRFSETEGRFRFQNRGKVSELKEGFRMDWKVFRIEGRFSGWMGSLKRPKEGLGFRIEGRFQNRRKVSEWMEGFQNGTFEGGGRKISLQAGLKGRKVSGRKGGRKERRKEGRFQEGEKKVPGRRKEGSRKEGRKEGRKNGRTEERKNERTKGRKDERKDGRKEGLTSSSWSSLFFFAFAPSDEASLASSPQTSSSTSSPQR
jgi:hypothetical protein